jgi:hypothetical protein
VRALRLLCVALAVATSGCFTPPQPPTPTAGEFHAELLGASPSTAAMRWNVALSNGHAETLHGVKVSIAVKYYRTRDAGHDEKTLDVPANNTTIVLLNTPYMGFGDYDYVLQAVGADGTILATEQDLFELCLC